MELSLDAIIRVIRIITEPGFLPSTIFWDPVFGVDLRITFDRGNILISGD